MTTADIRKNWAIVQAIPRKIWLSCDGRPLVQWVVGGGGGPDREVICQRKKAGNNLDGAGTYAGMIDAGDKKH
jgi:hypothetical protein